MTPIEKRIVWRAVTDLLAAGHTISVYDGEATVLRNSTALPDILAAMGATDQDILYVGPNSWVQFVWGNGCDVINDYTTNLESVLDAAITLSEELA